MAQVLNVDILDDKEPIVLVQKYIFDDRALLVFRKPTDEDEGNFHLSPGIEVDRSLFWNIEITLFSTVEELEPDGLLEQFAVIYRAEDNPPWHDGEDRPNASPYASIVYDPEADLYRCEPYFNGYDELETIAFPSFYATLGLSVHKLHDLLAQHGE